MEDINYAQEDEMAEGDEDEDEDVEMEYGDETDSAATSDSEDELEGGGDEDDGEDSNTGEWHDEDEEYEEDDLVENEDGEDGEDDDEPAAGEEVDEEEIMWQVCLQQLRHFHFPYGFHRTSGEEMTKMMKLLTTKRTKRKRTKRTNMEVNHLCFSKLLAEHHWQNQLPSFMQTKERNLIYYQMMKSKSPCIALTLLLTRCSVSMMKWVSLMCKASSKTGDSDSPVLLTSRGKSLMTGIPSFAGAVIVSQRTPFYLFAS
jgi:hypothetical protein